tara:strand:+ start:2093 stop:3595 length:1503 start_codon:yes stop_codon:yes gene_type:complete
MYLGMNYIDGSFTPTFPSFSSYEPHTGDEIGVFPQTGRDDIRTASVVEAVSAARNAQKEWLNLSRVQRADLFDVLAQLMKRDHEKMVAAISQETGKNLNESHAEVIEALHMCQVAVASGRQAFGSVIASELPTKDAYTMRKPKGVVAVISPWNFPLAIGSFWCSAPALVEGNTVVHKPSELTPMVAQMAAAWYDEAGFPPGVYNLIHGDGKVGSELVRSDVDCILFTGSAEVGQDIRKHCAETWHKTCSCEMGSKSATILFEDGDLDLALEVAVASAFKLSGQRCVSSGRLIVHRNLVEEFSAKFVEQVKATVSTGSPFVDVCGDEQMPFYGPLISKEQKERVIAYNQMVRADHDAIVLLDDPGREQDDTQFLNPMVYGCEWDTRKRFLTEEVFGPHVAIIPFDTVDCAIRIYNGTPYGLALGVVTEDFRIMRRCRDECNTGMLYLNGGSIAAESHLPFGGVGKSGNGWKSAVGTYAAVTEEIAVTTNFERGISWAQGMK